ncbi:hypothetical protein BDV95DRAFT_152625 [Massariosphaeria phaeospora]|uniref:Uncharacterized protein n=1 Tax=Massariosphaeria phaeospora TaxID=100035 RepID=A0A7C8IM07_9PLEO|nr:hypothetical protein BDV95DRAFT_152625 [Massariosphaeria phaeospora]
MASTVSAFTGVLQRSGASTRWPGIARLAPALAVFLAFLSAVQIVLSLWVGGLVIAAWTNGFKCVDGTGNRTYVPWPLTVAGYGRHGLVAKFSVAQDPGLGWVLLAGISAMLVCILSVSHSVFHCMRIVTNRRAAAWGLLVLLFAVCHYESAAAITIDYATVRNSIGTAICVSLQAEALAKKRNMRVVASNVAWVVRCIGIMGWIIYILLVAIAARRNAVQQQHTTRRVEELELEGVPPSQSGPRPSDASVALFPASATPRQIAAAPAPVHTAPSRHPVHAHGEEADIGIQALRSEAGDTRPGSVNNNNPFLDPAGNAINKPSKVPTTNPFADPVSVDPSSNPFADPVPTESSSNPFADPGAAGASSDPFVDPDSSWTMVPNTSPVKES